jgi:hypothetical protein
MVLVVAVLLAQLAPVFWALPAAFPMRPAGITSSATARDTKVPDPSSGTGTNPTSTVDLASAHFTKNAPSSTQPSVSVTSDSSSLRSAQNLLSLSSIRIPPNDAVQRDEIIQAEPMPSRRTWLALTFIQHGAAAFDAYSTREAISRGAVELDPTMRPFAHSPGLYAAIQVGPVLLDFVSRKMQRSQNNFLRRMWWLPQSMSTATFLYSGVHNLNVTGHP